MKTFLPYLYGLLIMIIIGTAVSYYFSIIRPGTLTKIQLADISVNGESFNESANSQTVKKKKTPEERALYVAERDKFEFDMLKDPTTGQIPDNIRALEMSVARRIPPFQESKRGAGFTVTPRGPNNLGGRTRAITFDVRYGTTNSIILAGGVSGGVFRSTNGGGSWVRVSPDDEIHSVTSIVQDPRAGFQDTWYYATGESLGNSASNGSSGLYTGQGIWKSTNNGITWTRLTNSNTGSSTSFDNRMDFIHKLAIDPSNGDIYAAALGTIRRSTDGGTTWATVLQPGVGGFNTSQWSDIAISSAGSAGGYFYATMHGTIGNNADGVWQSTTGDFGDWTQIAGNGSPTGWNASNAYGRIVVAIAPSNEDLVYFLYDNNNDNDCSGMSPAIEADFFLFNNNTNVWADSSANLPDDPCGCLDGSDPFSIQGGYDLCVAVKPDDANTVFIGGTNLYRSTNGGATTAGWAHIGGYSTVGCTHAQTPNHHPDIHMLTFPPTSNDTLYSGTDGGIARTNIVDVSPVWEELHTDYVTYQYYHVAIDPSVNSDLVIGGTQDNGTTQSPLAGVLTDHSDVFGGDGVAVGISSSGTRYYGVQNGVLTRESVNITPSGASSSLFITYFYLDPDNTELLYYAGGSELFRTTTASTVNSAGWTDMTGVAATAGSTIYSMATSRGTGYGASDANRKLYIGTAGGGVYRLNDPQFAAAATNPVDISPAGATGIASGIGVNPTDDNEILVSFSNYGTNNIYHTSNADNATPTWVNVEGNLSIASVRSASIMVEGGITYYIVGTSIGLYCTTTLNGAATVWTQIGSGSIRYAVARSLALRPADNFLLVGTHGNGMYMVEPPRDPDIYFTNTSSSYTETTTTVGACAGYTDVTVEMKIAAAPTGAATVTISNTGTAVEGEDYDFPSGNTLIFPDGATGDQQLTVRIYDEENLESSETLILDFAVTGVTDAAKAGFNQTHTMTIEDNDYGPVLGTTSDLGTGNFISSTPLAGNYEDTRQQTVYTAAELSAAGISAGAITSMAFRVYQVNSSQPYANFTIKIKHTTLGFGSSIPSFEEGATTVYSQSYTPTVGWNTFDFSTPFFWDGSSNILIDYCFNNSSTTNFDYIYTSNMGATAIWFNRDPGDGCAMTSVNWISDYRPNIRFLGTNIETSISSTDVEFGPNSTINIYNGGEVLLTLTNNSNYDYGCTTIEIDRAGTGATQAWSAATADYLTDKSFQITPTNNSPGVGDSYDITVYYTDAEITGWIAGSDPVYVPSDGKIVKSVGPISGLNPGNQNATVNASTTYAVFGSEHTYTATFTDGFSGFAVGNPVTAPLPVGLLSLSGEAVNRTTALSWMTSWELNSDYFEVERSLDGKNFMDIGQVKAVGNSDVEQSYQFVDINPNSGINYYRLRQVDLDGRVDYSNIIRVRLEGDERIVISPNPFEDHINLSFSMAEEREIQFTLFSIKGEQIIFRKIEVKGQTEEKIELPSLAQGVYLYQMNTGKGMEYGKLIKR